MLTIASLQDLHPTISWNQNVPLPTDFLKIVVLFCAIYEINIDTWKIDGWKAFSMDLCWCSISFIKI